MENSPFEAQWRRRFDEFGRTQDTDASIAGWSETGLETRVRAFLRYWRHRPSGERWLDLGCGAGTYSRLLAEQRLNVVGTDYSPSTLQKALLRSAQPIHWVSADARRLPFPDSSFDGALCFGITQALSDTLPAAKEAARVLKPGAELWVDALNGACIANVASTLLRRVKRLPARLRYDRVGRVRDALERAGFEVLAMYWVSIAPTGWQHTQRLLEDLVNRKVMQALPSVCSLLSHSFILRARR